MYFYVENPENDCDLEICNNLTSKKGQIHHKSLSSVCISISLCFIKQSERGNFVYKLNLNC